MTVNRYQPHLYVMPEDDANGQLANGFLLNPSVDTRKLQVLPEAGGWSALLDRFNHDYAPAMRKFPESRLLLLLDFDTVQNRSEKVRDAIPQDLRERVFLLGVWDEPEVLRAKLGISLEDIGSTLADECSNDTTEVWSDEQLGHNAAELERLRVSVKPFLFP